MNKSAKIILLAVAIILAVGGVLVFYYTIVSPPRKLDFSNQYLPPIRNGISRVDAMVKTDYNLDSVYTALTHRINFEWNDGFLADKERDQLLESFVVKYVPAYVKNCDNKFQQSVWDESVLNAIQAHIKELFSLATTNGVDIVGGDCRTSLNRVDGVINNYYRAKQVAKVGGFRGIADAKSQIEKANEYANMEPINNCASLMEQLRSVPARMEQAHYRYLEGEVEKLSKYRNYSETAYEDLATMVTKVLDEYNNNAKQTYGTVSDLSVLENRAGGYYSDAMDYFHP